MSTIDKAQKSENVILRPDDSNELTVTFPSGIAANYWKELTNMFHPDDGLSEMPMKKDLHKLKFTKKEDPRNLSLAIAKITMRYTHDLLDSKKVAHILKFGKLHHADMLVTNERS